MRWYDDSPQLILKLDRQAMQHRLEAPLQAPVTRPLVFDVAVDLQTPASSGVAGFIAYLRAALDGNASLLSHQLLAEQAENHLLTGILLAMRHNHSERLGGAAASGPAAPGTVRPRVVKRAQEFMASQAERSITLAEVCTHVGVSARSLQQGFQQATGASPMVFLRELRLDRVRAALLAASTDGRVPKVCDVAARYGFFHLGHFASHYRLRFGETPSETRLRGAVMPDR
jgi:transcriptional regulator GlxA family with amidase domain